MIGPIPTFAARSIASPDPVGIDSFLEAHAEAFTFYGSGKVALRDGLAGLVDPGQNVLVPAYLPDAVVEPFTELGLEPRYYRVRPSFAPDFADLEARLDAETAAITSVNYFGFPQPGLEEVSNLTDEYDCYHVDDNAHAALSVADGALLGTHGDIGITSLWKVLPIPNGAVLFCNSDEAIAAYEPSASAGVRDRLGVDDGVFVLKSAARNLLGDADAVRASIGALLGGDGRDGGADLDGDAAPETDGGTGTGTETEAGTGTEDRRNPPSVGTPKERYDAGKTPMSKLAATVLEEVDPEAIRTRRRTNYRAWRRVLAARDDVEVVYDALPEGICPQAVPVRAERPDRFVATLEDRGVGAYTWPRLSAAVREDPAYETARRLSERIVALPVHQNVEPSTIEEIGRRLSDRA